MDIVAVLTNQDDYAKTRNYWKYLKAKLKKEGSQVVSATTQLKILAPIVSALNNLDMEIIIYEPGAV